MAKLSNPPRRFAIVSHPAMPESANEARQAAEFLQNHGTAATAYPTIYDEELVDRMSKGDFDILIAVGGDGTMLRSSHLCAPLNVPILGINMGRFGFLTEASQAEWSAPLQSMLEGDFWLEERMMLHAELWRAEKRLQTWEVLNEVVACRGKTVRPIQLNACVDDQELARYAADGLIAATPTGSTAYALAVGGPIIYPELRNILIIPIAPHLSVDRGVILPADSQVTIKVITSHQAVLSADGQKPIKLRDGDLIQVAASQHTARFVRFNSGGQFYQKITNHMERNPTTGLTL
jgi:NAD+ kinase